MNSHHVDQLFLIGNEEESLVIERALRTAILTVVEVVNGINSNRLQHYQSKVTEKESENVYLRVELDKAEKELALLRQFVSFQQEQSCEESNASTSASTQALTLDNKLNVETSSCVEEEGTVNELQSRIKQSKNVRRGPLSAAAKQKRYRARRDARRATYLESEKRRSKRDRELGKRKLIRECSVSRLRVIRRKWRLAKEKSRTAKFEFDFLSTLPVSPEYLQPHLQGHSVDFQFECLGEVTTTAAVQDHFDFPTSSSEQHALLFSVSGCVENNSNSMSSPVVNQEPPSTDSVYIKFEVKDEQVCSEQDDSCVFDREPPEDFSHQKDSMFETGRPTSYSAQQTEDTSPSSDSWLRKRNKALERQRRYRERIHSDPEKLQAYLEKDRCRSSKRTPIHELPEQIQKQRRAMWREATRRSRARKKSQRLEPPENCFSHQKDSMFETRRPTSCSAQQTEDTSPSSDSCLRKRNKALERQQRYRERIHSDPEKLQAYLEKDRCRSSKRTPIHELPEQIQKQRRAMWREATRRSRARKKSHLGQWTEPL